jgi:hypothetical protein
VDAVDASSSQPGLHSSGSTTDPNLGPQTTDANNNESGAQHRNLRANTPAKSNGSPANSARTATGRSRSQSFSLAGSPHASLGSTNHHGRDSPQIPKLSLSRNMRAGSPHTTATTLLQLANTSNSNSNNSNSSSSRKKLQQQQQQGDQGQQPPPPERPRRPSIILSIPEFRGNSPHMRGNANNAAGMNTHTTSVVHSSANSPGMEGDISARASPARGGGGVVGSIPLGCPPMMMVRNNSYSRLLDQGTGGAEGGVLLSPSPLGGGGGGGW